METDELRERLEDLQLLTYKIAEEMGIIEKLLKHTEEGKNDGKYEVRQKFDEA